MSTKKSLKTLIEEGNNDFSRSWFVDEHFVSYKGMGPQDDYYDAVIRDGFVLTARYDFNAPESMKRYVCLPSITEQAYAEYQGDDGVEFLHLCLSKAKEAGLEYQRN